MRCQWHHWRRHHHSTAKAKVPHLLLSILNRPPPRIAGSQELNGAKMRMGDLTILDYFNTCWKLKIKPQPSRPFADGAKVPPNSSLANSPLSLLGRSGYGKKKYTWSSNWKAELEIKIESAHSVQLDGCEHEFLQRASCMSPACVALAAHRFAALTLTKADGLWRDCRHF